MEGSADSRVARRPKRRRPRAAAVGLAVVVLLLAAIGGIAWQMLFRAENPQPRGRGVEFTVEKGQSFTQVAEALAKRGIIANSLMFRIRARGAAETRSIKPGDYKLATGMPYDLVLKKLASGPDIIYYQVTIPEGFTARRVAARFAKETGVSEEEFLALVLHGAPQFEDGHPYLKDAHDGSLEGYLFPKTYRIKQGTKPKAMVELMLKQFDKEITAVDLSDATSRGYTLQQVVTIASILERETKLPKEFPLVSSATYTRHAIPMRLQLDSTVFYGLPEGTTVLHNADLQKPTPWNTYRRAGLPATPICNPGVSAIDAAAHPAKTKYLYYVLTSKDGSQTFTTNYADFLKAVKKYRTLFGY